MKKITLKKALVIFTLVFTVGTGSLFARKNVRQNQKNSKNAARLETQNSQVKNKKTERSRNMKQNIDAMGTVLSVNEKSISIKNTDGDIITVSINPQTMIIRGLSTEDKNTENSKPNTKNQRTRELLAASDISKGDWITVSAFNTETEILEAARVCVLAN
ncbi:MAG TPA: hypothetical protein VFC68_03635 [Treponemataceae bacterium]|nr:hypothetical protein [Treponemataceae bacterium]